jgi:hypothetical protein
MTTKKNTPKMTPAKVERAKRSTEATQSRPVEARPFAGLKESDLKSRVVDSTVERQSADVVRVVKRAKGRKGAP